MDGDVRGEATASMTTADRAQPLAPAFARVDVFRDAAPVLEAWAELERTAPCSIYQTRAWLLPWMDTLGRKAGLAPLFVLASGADGRPLALLALGVLKRGPLRIARWLGGNDANFNMPLLRPGLGVTRADVARLFREAAMRCGADRPDLFELPNQPFAWAGRDNPLASVAHHLSPSAAHGTQLQPDAESFFASKLSKETRKKLRKKETRLATMGPLTHLVAATAAEQREVLDAFIAQKVERFRAQGIVSEFDTPEMRAFIEATSAPNGRGIELHALRCGARIVAVYGGGVHGGQWSGMFNAFDGDEEIAKSSPGDLLLMRIIAKSCADGVSRFDLGIGEARYKATLCDERIELFDVVLPVSPRGALFAGVVAVRQRAKRAIKSSPRLFALAKRVRALASRP